MSTFSLQLKETMHITFSVTKSIALKLYSKVKVGNDQEIAQSEINSNSKNREGKTKLTLRYLY